MLRSYCHPSRTPGACALAAVLVAACSGGSHSPREPANHGSAPAVERTRPASGAPEIDMCIDVDDVQIEPLDLEALDDEMPAAQGAVAEHLAGLAAHGSPVALNPGPHGDRGFAVPFVRCRAGACQAGILTMDAAGRELGVTPLPGLDQVTPELPVDMVSAQADVNSDGDADLWIGYRLGDPATMPSEQHVAALALPALTLQWHGVVARSSPRAGDRGCDGALYPVDADCDGDGDLLLVERCGPMECLNDDSTGCGRDAVAERVAVYAWNGRSYGERTPSSPGAKP